MLVLSALQGCPETLFAGLDGVYDVDGMQTDEFGSFPRSGLAVVRRDGDGVHLHIAFDVLETLSMSARPIAGGMLALGGSGIEGGDIVVSATGSATLTRAGGMFRFTAVIDVDSFIGGTRLTVAIERPASGTPDEFSGDYRLQLHHEGSGGGPYDSHVDLPVAVPASGLATCGASSDVREDDGTVLAEVGEAQCRISPRGRFSYSTSYSGADFPLQLFGNLRAGGGQNAGGTFWIAAFPSVREHGTWDVAASPL